MENESLQGKKIIMSLGQKTLVILFLTVIGLTGILHVATRILLLRKFAALEERETRNAVERAQNAINDAIETLSATTNDYGAWDKTYAFMEHPAALASMQQEFKNEALQGLHINSVLIMDPAGTVAFFKAFDSSLKLERNFAELKELLAADSLGQTGGQFVHSCIWRPDTFWTSYFDCGLSNSYVR